MVDAEAADAGWIDNEASDEEDTEVVEFVDQGWKLLRHMDTPCPVGF